MTPVLCVHASAFGKDVVFRFGDARFSIEGGALAVRSITPVPADLMAFAAGVWKAAWHEDAQGEPMGLLPSGPSTTPARHMVEETTSPETVPPSFPPLSEQQSTTSTEASDDQARHLREQKIIEALRMRPYENLASFSASLSESPGDIERALITALQHKSVDPNHIAVAATQAKLDLILPTLISTRQPQGVREIMQHLRQNADTRECDYVQLHIWLRRNPIKRTS
jgi:hypothetical protein